MCLEKSLESPVSLDVVLRNKKYMIFLEHRDIRDSSSKSKRKLNAKQSKNTQNRKKQYTWRMPSWNVIVYRSLPWFPGEGLRSPCKSFGILFEATAVCFVEYVAKLCVGDTTLMATALWYEQEKITDVGDKNNPAG